MYCTSSTILQPRLHGAIALIPVPIVCYAQTHTIGPSTCWDDLPAVSPQLRLGFALGGPRNVGRGRKTASWRPTLYTHACAGTSTRIRRSYTRMYWYWEAGCTCTVHPYMYVHVLVLVPVPLYVLVSLYYICHWTDCLSGIFW